jgi:hypothetical protein
VHRTAVLASQTVVKQTSSLSDDVGVGSATSKLKPCSVIGTPPVRGPFEIVIEVSTGLSYENVLNLVPTTAAIVIAAVPRSPRFLPKLVPAALGKHVTDVSDTQAWLSQYDEPSRTVGEVLEFPKFTPLKVTLRPADVAILYSTINETTGASYVRSDFPVPVSSETVTIANNAFVSPL